MNRVVVFRRFFERVQEFWKYGMELYIVYPKFEQLEDDVFLALKNQVEEVNMAVVYEVSEDEKNICLMEVTKHY